MSDTEDENENRIHPYQQPRFWYIKNIVPVGTRYRQLRIVIGNKYYPKWEVWVWVYRYDERPMRTGKISFKPTKCGIDQFSYIRVAQEAREYVDRWLAFARIVKRWWGFNRYYRKLKSRIEYASSHIEFRPFVVCTLDRLIEYATRPESVDTVKYIERMAEPLLPYQLLGPTEKVSSYKCKRVIKTKVLRWNYVKEEMRVFIFKSKYGVQHDRSIAVDLDDDFWTPVFKLPGKPWQEKADCNIYGSADWCCNKSLVEYILEKRSLIRYCLFDFRTVVNTRLRGADLDDAMPIFLRIAIDITQVNRSLKWPRLVALLPVEMAECPIPLRSPVVG